MDRLLPVFRRKGGRYLVLSDSLDALTIRHEHREKQYIPPKDVAKVKQIAADAVSRLGGDPTNTKHLLGQFTIQFGQYRNQTFKWLLENALGYVAFLLVRIEKELKSETETVTKQPNWLNKMALRKYLRLFEEGVEAIQLKSQEKRPNIPARKSSDPAGHDEGFTDSEDAELCSMAEEMEKELQAYSVDSQPNQQIYLPSE